MSNKIKSDKIPADVSVEEFLKSGESSNAVVLLYPINIREKVHKYEFEMAAPGFKKSDFTINSEGGLLTINAITEHEKIREDDNYTRKEYLRSSISRSFVLPEDVLVGHISAEYHNGILTIDLKKTDRFLIGKKHVKVD
jgi:HSP20 family protein